jgi:F-type H+-transporting ATPase subunit d
MAARRVASSSVDWAEFARKIPASQKAAFTAFKQKHDGYLRAVNTLPEKSPAIDFNAYKSKIAIAGMVDDFQKKYETLQIPYPKDNVSSEVSCFLSASTECTQDLRITLLLLLFADSFSKMDRKSVP